MTTNDTIFLDGVQDISGFRAGEAVLTVVCFDRANIVMALKPELLRELIAEAQTLLDSLEAPGSPERACERYAEEHEHETAV